jgi:hypothetical protein
VRGWENSLTMPSPFLYLPEFEDGKWPQGKAEGGSELRDPKARAGSGGVGRSALALALCLVAALGALVGAPGAGAAAPEELWTACNGSELEAEDGSPIPPALAGRRCDIPRGVAADPDQGHVYVGDSINRRVLDFNALGEFVRAWGWDVVQGGVAGFEVCVIDAGDECKTGSTGFGPGQFGSPQGLAVDSAGSVYVVDRGLPSNQRVQKFDRKGEFLLMFGGEVNKTTETDVCTKADLEGGEECGAGTTGPEQGEFGEWPVTGDWIAVDRNGTATDADDSVYVGDEERIQRFDTEGAYQDEIARPGETVKSLAVDPDGDLYAGPNSGSNVTKLDPTGVEACTMEVARPNGVATDSFGTVHVINRGLPQTPPVPLEVVSFDASNCEEIDRFQPQGFGLNSTGIEANHCQGSEEPGNLYLADWGDNDFLRAYGTDPIGCFRARTLPADPVGETEATLNGTVNPKGEAVEGCRFEYGTTTAYGEPPVPCAEYEEGGEWESLSSPEAQLTGTEPIPVRSPIEGLDAATTYHFRVSAEIGEEDEPGADEQFKTLGPPVISEAHVLAATDTEATLKALVNPEGFPTDCSFQYTTQADFEAREAEEEGEGFAGAQSTPEQAVGSDRAEHETGASLSGLEPGTAYRWRALCDNTAEQDNGTTAGEDLPLATYPSFSPPTECPNQDRRSGPSAFLPDCRAYEMVSPVQKNGGDILPFPGIAQSVTGGQKVFYEANPSFGDAQNSWYGNQYIATRGDSGWPSHGIHPPVVGDKAFDFPGALGLINDTLAHTPDLCSTWFYDYLTPSYTPEGQEDHADLYRRDNCGAGEGELEALLPDPPALSEEARDAYLGGDSIQGVSEDGTIAVFTARAQLPHAPEANEGDNRQIYARHCPSAATKICGPGRPEEGEVKLVSLLPDGSTGDPSPGDGMGFASEVHSAIGAGATLNLENAVSRDGERAYWTNAINATSGLGKVYLRIHPEQGKVADECDDNATIACTVEVSEGTSAFFWAAASDGSAAVYSEGEELYEFSLARHEAEEEPSRLIAEGALGVVGSSEDLSRIYFVSTEKIAGSGENSEEDEAIEGEPNLYLYEAGEGEGGPGYEFVGTLRNDDVGIGPPNQPYNLVFDERSRRTARTSPGGERLVFLSRARLTGYDNTDAIEAGKADVEVFAYRAESGELLCASCNPSGARPRGREFAYPYWKTAGSANHGVFAAAWIPAPELPLRASRLVSDDGERILFNSNDALVPRDANGTMDVYEWQAPGKGRCAKSSPSYFPQNGGCIDLISSGQGGFESQVWEADADGSDVFFSTESSLVPPDTGLVDLYDARIGGGFTYPEAEAECEGEACSNAPAAPEFDAPASGAYRGPENAVSPRSCRAPARRAARLSRRAKRLRGAARQARRAGNRAATRKRARRARRLARRAKKASRKAKRCRRANRKRGRAR